MALTHTTPTPQTPNPQIAMANKFYFLSFLNLPTTKSRCMQISHSNSHYNKQKELIDMFSLKFLTQISKVMEIYNKHNIDMSNKDSL
jgi:hypothetical protein